MIAEQIKEVLKNSETKWTHFKETHYFAELLKVLKIIFISTADVMLLFTCSFFFPNLIALGYICHYGAHMYSLTFER